MVDYAGQRKQFGQAIGNFQLVQQMLADSVIEINSARLMVWHAAWMIDQGLDARDFIAMVKVQAAETLGRATDRAVQVFGQFVIKVALPALLFNALSNLSLFVIGGTLVGLPIGR